MNSIVPTPLSSSSSSSTLTSFLHLKTPFLTLTRSPFLRLTITKPRFPSVRLRVSSDHAVKSEDKPSFTNNLKSLLKTAILVTAVASRFSSLPAKADSPITISEQTFDDVQQEEEQIETQLPKERLSPLSELLESSSEAIEALRSLLQEKLENREDAEALEILKRLVSAQPEATEWKFLMARLLIELGRPQDARQVFEEILTQNPLSFEALFENALLMDRCGEREAVLKRLEEALAIAEEEEKVKEARDVKMIMAQVQFLQKNVDGALMSYEELSKEDPDDFRPYFCRGTIYSLLDRNAEAKEQFAKYKELSPRKFEVEGYLRTSLSRMKLFGTDEENREEN